jgi:hypothetical protein
MLAASGDCEQRAEMAALVIAAWLDAMPAGTLSAPNPPPALAPAPSPPLPAVEPGRAAVLPVEGARPRTLMGVGLLGMADTQGAAAGFALEAAMPNLFGDFGWAAEASLSMPREMTVGQGTARYWRPTVALMATGEVRLGDWALRPRAGAALGILAVRGSNYQNATSATTVTWGGGAGIAAARAWQGKELWVRLDALTWPQGRAVRSHQLPAGPDIVVALPDWEARLFVGISWGARR